MSSCNFGNASSYSFISLAFFCSPHVSGFIHDCPGSAMLSPQFLNNWSAVSAFSNAVLGLSLAGSVKYPSIFFFPSPRQMYLLCCLLFYLQRPIACLLPQSILEYQEELDLDYYL